MRSAIIAQLEPRRSDARFKRSAYALLHRAPVTPLTVTFEDNGTGAVPPSTSAAADILSDHDGAVKAACDSAGNSHSRLLLIMMVMKYPDRQALSVVAVM
jgi:hypothetical protein